MFNQKSLLKMAHKGAFWYVLLIIVSTILGTGLAIISPMISKELIDKSIPDRDTAMVIWLIAAMGGLLLIKSITSYLLIYFGRLLQNKVEINIKNATFMHMQKIRVDYADRKNEGHFISRINEDAANISQLIRYIPENAISGILLSVTSLTMGFLFDWAIGLVMTIVFVILVGFTLSLRRGFRNRRKEIKRHNELVSMTIINSISGTKESKIFLAEDREVVKFNKFLDQLHQTWRKMFKLMGKWMSFNTLILSSIAVIILSIGSVRYLQGAVTIGGITASMMYATQIQVPINNFMSAYDIVSTSQTSIMRVLEFLNTEEELYGVGVKFNPDVRVQGGIEFKNVSFDYEIVDEEFLSQGEDWNKYRDNKKNKHIETKEKVFKKVLKNVSFKIEPGQKVAFVGETGSGKSTIFKLILRFYEQQEGQILIDGIDHKQLQIEEVRKNISYLQQEPYLFYDSIKNNLLFAMDEHIDEKEADVLIQNALDIAKASEFVSELPNGINQTVGPRGVNLSGGQKQRIAISRAIIKNAPIILFDEATSALDNETEKSIQKSINDISKNSTMLFIAHRLSTIHSLDKIFVLKNGEIVEEGTHNELMKKKGYYHKLNTATE